MNCQLRCSVFVVLLVSLGLGGCTIAKFSGRGVYPIMLNAPQTKLELIEHVKVSKTINQSKAYDATELVSEIFAERDADAIVNVTFTVRRNFGNILLGFITLGIANATTIILEGDLVRTPQGLGHLSFPGSQAETPAVGLDALKNGAVECNSVMIVRVPSGYALIRYDPTQIDVPD